MFASDIPTPSDLKPEDPRFPQLVSAAFPFLELLESTLRGTRALDCSASLEGAAEVLAQRSPPGGPPEAGTVCWCPRVLGVLWRIPQR